MLESYIYIGLALLALIPTFWYMVSTVKKTDLEEEA